MRAAPVPHLRAERDDVRHASPGRPHRHPAQVAAAARRDPRDAGVRRFEPAVFLQLLATHRPTTLSLAPPLVAFLATHPLVTADHLASLRTVSILRA